MRGWVLIGHRQTVYKCITPDQMHCRPECTIQIYLIINVCTRNYQVHDIFVFVFPPLFQVLTRYVLDRRKHFAEAQRRHSHREGRTAALRNRGWLFLGHYLDKQAQAIDSHTAGLLLLNSHLKIKGQRWPRSK